MAEWQRIVNTTIQKHLRGFEQCVMRDRILLSRLQERGAVEYNYSGDGLTWRVKKDQRDLVTNNGAQSTAFTPKNLYQTCTLDYEGYIITDKVTKRERLKNRNQEAIINFFGDLVQDMFDDLEDRFATELYIDSSASGNSGRLSGIETMMAATQTINSTVTGSTTPRTANAADIVGYPNDTYAGVSTVLGADGGTWNANWPLGTGDPNFDFFSPLIVNYTSSGFDGQSTSWTTNCSAAVSYMLIHGNTRKASQGMIDLVLLDAELYRQLAEKQKTNERVLINDGDSSRKYGQPRKGFFMDNAEVTWEYGVPREVGYGFNLKQLKLISMQNKLFVADPMEWDPESRSYRIAVDFLGQLRFKSPRYFAKLVELA